MESGADKIRRAAGSYIELARRLGEERVKIRAGDIVRELRLENRTPSVCSALSSVKFQQQYGVRLEEREGPSQSTSTQFTYSILSGRTPKSSFESLLGAGEEAYEKVGGADAWHREMRESFDR
ncbi:ATPase [Fimbriimonas ginsengisoli Gsoil 348]|uniref:ATPase n=1 Tax=Fimbriimonas ginsengisoli Gsoil 348 TaxID=661478 RepID=A0A068NT78_FIMGI|nr:ATPase [Fimbriimonas ginsengisoli Gsoil 348]